MKTLLLLLLTVSTLSAQVSVKFYGAGNTQGLPQYWPQVIQQTTNPPTGFVLMTQADLENCIATNQPAYNAWESNKTYLAKAKTDAALAEFIAKMDKIETWIDKTQGTNSLNNAQRDNAINDLCQAFKKLRKALSTIYKPEEE